MQDETKHSTAMSVADKSLAMQRLLHQNSDRLDAYITHRLPPDLKSLIEPRDVLQDVFFEAFRRLEDFEPRSEEASFRWLITITRHRILALIRAHRSGMRNPKKAGNLVDFDNVASMLSELAVYYRTPSQSAMSHEIAAIVQRSLDTLKPDFKEAIQLRYITGLSAEQSAAKMGRTQAAVFMLCQRGLKSLKAQLVSAGAFSRI